VPGQLVHGRIISRVNPGLFRVGAAGQVFMAESDLPLQEGQRLTARVEMGDAKIFLRIFEESGRGTPRVYELADPDEVRRVLVGLGHHPEQAQITEFQERLDRYRHYGYLPGAEPSDVWILAILWTRGIRGGADIYALLSYYLRQATYRESVLPSPEKTAELTSAPPSFSGNAVTPRERENQFSRISSSDETADFILERRNETLALLNRNYEEAGNFAHDEVLDNAGCLLSLKKETQELSRWVDNPALPTLALETAQSQGRMKARIHKLNAAEKSQNRILEAWLRDWETGLRKSELELENIEILEVDHTETLRFIFWRQWESEGIRDTLR
jgi:hypothetical protein